MKSLGVSLMATGMLCVMASVASAADQLWWSNSQDPTGISVVDLAGATVTQPVGPGVVTGGTTADLAGGRIIYADSGAKQIVSINPDGSDPQVLASTGSSNATVAGGLDSIYGIAFDTTRQRVYWGDDTTRSIYYVSTVDPSVGGRLHQDPGANHVESPVYDALSDRVYWVNYEDATIEFSNPDASGYTIVTPTGSCTAQSVMYSVIVDTAAGKLYFNGNEGLQRANLDGTLCENLAGDTNTYGLALDKDAGRVYWTNDSSDVVGYTDVTTNVATVLSSSWTGSALADPYYPIISKTPSATSKAVAKVANTLTCQVTWSRDLTGAFMYRSPQGTPSIAWSRDGTPITGATGATLVADTPGNYTCSQTATNIAGATTVDASATVSASDLPVLVPPGLARNKTALAIGKLRITLTSSVTVNGAGTLRQRAVRRGKAITLCTTRRTITGPGTYKLRCVMGKAVRNKLRKGAIKYTLITTFTNTNGAVATNRAGGTLPMSVTHVLQASAE